MCENVLYIKDSLLQNSWRSEPANAECTIKVFYVCCAVLERII